MSGKRFPNISAILATLRSGGDFNLSSNGLAVATLRPLALTRFQSDAPALMTNRLAQAFGLINDDVDMSAAFRHGKMNFAPDTDTALIYLLKAAHVTPCVQVLGPQQNSGPVVEISDLKKYAATDNTLVFDRSVRLPTEEIADAEAFLFTDLFDSKREHIALYMRAPITGAEALPLVRIHSKCLTGDVLGSLRCDCGEQLKLAKRQIAASGYGALIYLDQEGRGIGLRNKLAAYNLQDKGQDTFEANHQLGYEADERRYTAAATMLKHLGMDRINLLTNNPDKIQQIAPDIEVVDRVALITDSQPQNKSYLEAKKASGHML